MLIKLFLAFFKVGLFAIGGGLATLPFLYELSAKTHWFSYNDIADILAISESTPGALGVNMATFAGFKTMGVIGGISSTIGLIAPSIVIVIIIAHFLKRFQSSQRVQNALYALRPASMAMISMAAINVAKTSIVNTEASSLSSFFLWKAIFFAFILFIVQRKIKFHPIVYILTSAIIGIVFQM